MPTPPKVAMTEFFHTGTDTGVPTAWKRVGYSM